MKMKVIFILDIRIHARLRCANLKMQISFICVTPRSKELPAMKTHHRSLGRLLYLATIAAFAAGFVGCSRSDDASPADSDREHDAGTNDGNSGADSHADAANPVDGANHDTGTPDSATSDTGTPDSTTPDG